MAGNSLRLTEKLAEVRSALRDLHTKATRLHELNLDEMAGFGPARMNALCQVLEQGRHRVAHRMMELDGTDGAKPALDGLNIADAAQDFDPAEFLSACRDCCRLLCVTSRQAELDREPATVALMCDLILRMEKQLWLLDSASFRPNGVAPNVSLFLQGKA